MAVAFYENLDLLILGDNGVGKSTLINCYLTRQFSSIPSGTLKSKIELPGSEYGCNYVNIHLCDTRTNNNKWNENLEKRIIESSAILIIGSWDNEQSINRIENHWLPSVSKLCSTYCIPIFILINKSDMLGGLDNTDFMNQEYRSSLCKQLQSHSSIKHVFQTSCIEIKSVVNAFDIAIQSMVYPLHKLVINQSDYLYKSMQSNPSFAYYQSISKMPRKNALSANNNPIQIITEKFLIALKRIYHILDRDNDTLLSDDEVLYYYRNCLTLNSMKLHQLHRLKKWLMNGTKCLQQQQQQSINDEEEKMDYEPLKIVYVSNNKLTFYGFIQLHLILIQMLQHDMIWKSLQKFGFQRKDLNIALNVFPTLPNKAQITKFALLRNPMINKMNSRSIQYELSPNVSSFLISIFIKFCQNQHNEYNDDQKKSKTMHEFCSCFVLISNNSNGNGLNDLFSEYGINDKNPFNNDDLQLVGCTNSNKITLTQWLSLWSLMICYETERAMKYLVQMGAPTIFPSVIGDFNAKWNDYAIPQIADSDNVHQRFLNVLVVSYPFNANLTHQFIRSSVDDFSHSHSSSNLFADTYQSPQTPKRTNAHKLATKMPAASRTGSLSPIRENVECLKSPTLYENEVHNDAGDEDKNDCIQRLNTTLFLKAMHQKSNKYSYGMLTDEQKSKQIYNEHIAYLHKKNKHKRKALINVNLLNKDRGIDAYHTLFDCWPKYGENDDKIGQNELFETKRKMMEKELGSYDAIIYLHTFESMQCQKKNLLNLFDICRDVKMPIICVEIPFDVASNYNGDDTNENDIEVIDIDDDEAAALDMINGNGKTSKIGTPNQVKQEECIKCLNEILSVYDLPKRVIRWESFSEDQHRFNEDLINCLHFRALYVPKTKWQIRKSNAIKYTKRASMYALGIGLCAYFIPMNNVKKYFEINGNVKTKKNQKIIQKNEKQQNSVRFRTKYKGKKRRESEHRWRSQMIAVAVVTSVFYGGYYIYDRVRMNRNENDNENENEEEENEGSKENEMSGWTYLLSFFAPTFDDRDNCDDDDLSLTSFGFLNSPKISDAGRDS